MTDQKALFCTINFSALFSRKTSSISDKPELLLYGKIQSQHFIPIPSDFGSFQSSHLHSRTLVVKESQ